VNELTPLLIALGHNWLAVITGVIVLWLVVTRLVETSEAAAKLLGPLGRRIIRGYQHRQERYRADIAQEAKQIAVELLPKVVPSDYGVVKTQLSNIIARVTELEVENDAMRGFIVTDEEWHFYYDLSKAAGYKTIPPRLTWMDFLDRWKEGWRPLPLKAGLQDGPLHDE
jgi:hypothetical protein